NVVTYDVVIAVDNPALKLKPGMTATVSVTTAQRDAVLKIPLRAVRFNPERKPAGAEETPASRPGTTRAGGAGRREAPAVWAVQPDGGLRKVEVRLGVRNDQYAEVLSDPLQPGDQLAVAFRRGTQHRTEQRPPTFGGGGRFR